jgi:hypothetical protein
MDDAILDALRLHGDEADRASLWRFGLVCLAQSNRPVPPAGSLCEYGCLRRAWAVNQSAPLAIQDRRAGKRAAAFDTNKAADGGGPCNLISPKRDRSRQETAFVAERDLLLVISKIQNVGRSKSRGTTLKQRAVP